MRRHGFALGMALSAALGACGGTSTIVGGDGGASDSGEENDSTAVDSGREGPEGGGGACPSLASAEVMLDIPPACGACLGASCCSELDSCEGDGACMAIVLCVARCRTDGGTNESCTPGCTMQSSSGTATTEIDALFECVEGHCSAPCN
jgi:hypothetical protein